STVNAIVVNDERPSASDTLHGSDFAPGDAVTVVENEKTLSPGVASPFDPSSNSVWAGEPPIALRSQTTARLVLGGGVPGVRVTGGGLGRPGVVAAGGAEPTRVGLLQKCAGEPELGGAGAPAAKSEPLLSVSVQPPFARRAAVVFERPGAGVGPSKKFT